jgi:hypothetical protein
MTSYTKGELLRYAIAFALMRVRFKRRKLELSEADRYQIAADTVAELRKNGQWRELDDVVNPPVGPSVSTGGLGFAMARPGRTTS